MNYQQFREQLYVLLSANEKATGNKLKEQYIKAYKQVYAEINKLYASLGSNPADYYTEAVRYGRLTKTLEAIDAILKNTFNVNNSEIINLSTKSVTDAYYGSSYANMWVSSYSLPLINQNAVALSVYYTPKAWENFYSAARTDAQVAVGRAIMPKSGKTLKQIFLENDAKSLRNVQDTITRGLITGTSSQNMANQLKDTFDGSYTNSIRVARTESARNQNAGSYLADDSARKMGVKITRVWVASLDDRTRVSHSEADGQEEDKDGMFNVGGELLPFPAGGSDPSNNINCRCRVVEKVNDEPLEVRRGKDPVTGKSEVFSYKTYNEWLDSKGLKRDSKGIIVKK